MKPDVVALLRDIFDISSDQPITPATALSDLGLDSLDISSLIFACEEAAERDLSEAEISSVQTVGQLAKLF